MMSSSNEADLLEIDGFESEDVLREQASDEDTEDASETEVEKKDEEFTGIKEQMYQDKLSQFRKQLQQLKDGSLAVYMKKVKKLNQQYNERIVQNTISVESEVKLIEEQYVQEKAAAAKEFEEKKVDMNCTLIQELEIKKQVIESERSVMELTGDTMVVKPVTTRKLRRRPNDPVPVPEKRGKPSPVQLTDTLDDDDIAGDLALVQQMTGKVVSKPLVPTGGHTGVFAQSGGDVVREAVIEDGKLYFDKRCYSKDQSIVVETKDQGKVNAVIVNIGTDELIVKKLPEGTKIKISISSLQKGLYSIRKRPN